MQVLAGIIKEDQANQPELYELYQDFSESGSVLFTSEDEISIRFIIPVSEFEAVTQGKQNSVTDEDGESYPCDKDFADQVLESDRMNHEEYDINEY